jgi:hypothetical protein
VESALDHAQRDEPGDLPRETGAFGGRYDGVEVAGTAVTLFDGVLRTPHQHPLQLSAVV